MAHESGKHERCKPSVLSHSNGVQVSVWKSMGYDKANNGHCIRCRRNGLD